MKQYFEWLKSQVDFLDFPEKYDRLFSALQARIFTYKHPMDKNRAMDAISMRDLYREETEKRAPSNVLPPTVLEFFVAISKRMNYICSSFDQDKTKEIFWRLMANLKLNDMSDVRYEILGGDRQVNDILDRFLDRQYEVDGSDGGLFPMARPRQNQREIEIWYQMNQYLSDPNGEDLKSY